MENKIRWPLIIVGMIFILVFISYFTVKSRHPEINVDPCADVRPPDSVFEKTGIDFKFAEIKYNNFVLGRVDLNVDPEVVNLASKAVLNSQIMTYIHCRQQKVLGWEPELLQYHATMEIFLRTNPSSKEDIEYQKLNPLPTKMKKIETAVSETPESFEIGEPNRFEEDVLRVKKNLSYSLNTLSDENVSESAKKREKMKIRSCIRDFNGISDNNLRIPYQSEKYRYIGEASTALALNSSYKNVQKENAEKAISNYNVALDKISMIRKNRSKNIYTRELNKWLDDIYAEDKIKFFTLIALALTGKDEMVKNKIKKEIRKLEEKESYVLEEYDYHNHSTLKWVYE